LLGAGEGIRTLDPNLGKVVLRLRRHATFTRGKQQYLFGKTVARWGADLRGLRLIAAVFLSAITDVVGLVVKNVTDNPCFMGISWARPKVCQANHLI
jgi:hypothetical protein